MDSIPNNLSRSEQQVWQLYLIGVKQKWLQYVGGNQLPWPDPVSISVIRRAVHGEGTVDYLGQRRRVGRVR